MKLIIQSYPQIVLQSWKRSTIIWFSYQ